MSHFDTCKNAKACAHFAEKGRPAYLIGIEARAIGFCKPCLDAGIGEAAGLQGPGPAHSHAAGPATRETLQDAAAKLLLTFAPHSEQAGEPEAQGDQTTVSETQSDEDSGPLARLERRLQPMVTALSDAQGALKVDLDGDGKLEKFETAAEASTIREFGGSAFSPTKKAEDTVQGWKDLSTDPVSFNKDIKETLTANLSESAVALLSEALTQVIPSKTSPEPVLVVKRSAADPAGPVRNSELFFSLAYQGSNFLMNGRRFDWADDAFPRYAFRYEIMRDSKAGAVIPQLHPDAPKADDYNCASLVSKEECRAIFGDMTPEAVALGMARIARLWGDASVSSLSEKGELSSLVGSEHLPKDLAGSAAHYAAAIGLGLDSMRAYKQHRRSPASNVGRIFTEFLEEKVADKFASEDAAVAYLLSNPDEVDDFMFNEEATNWLLKNRLEKLGAQQMPSAEILAEVRQAQAKVAAFTNLIDKKWAETYEKDGTSALARRFGYPVGLPVDMLRPQHFLPGGYLVEGGWLKVSEGESFSFDVNFPVDENGRPDPSFEEWDKLSPVATVRKNAPALARLGDLAEACASASEAWHVAYNRGLPRDSLYGAAQLSLIDPNINAASYDDFSGTVRGMYHPNLRGLELAVGSKMRFFPTFSSKLSAVARRHAAKSVAPRGVLSLAEIDLANWRLSRLADNQCGNEYGVNTVKDGEKAPFNFTRLSREFHEGIQDKIRKFGKDDGLITFAQPDEDFVRPLVGRQRGEAMRFFVERPGSYLRRTGLSGLREGAPKAVYEQIKAPLTPWSAYLDPALGSTTDLTTAANHAPGQQSLNPYAFVATGSGTLRTDGIKEVESLAFNKFMTVGPGRRGENLPRRLRFAALSLGEKAARSGLIDPRIIENGSDDARLEVFENVHSHVAQEAYITVDEPKYAPELEKAPWHRPILYIKDFELGEMGDSYAKLGGTDDEKKAVLQMFLAGKQSSRQKLFDVARESMSMMQLNFTYPADTRLTYGDLAATGPSLIEKGTTPEIRKQGLTRGVAITKRRIATFGALINGMKGEDTRLSRKGDALVTSEPFLLASRSGYGASGLENTPIRYGDTAPIKAADYIKAWSKIVMDEGEAGAYEQAEFASQSDTTRTTFKKMKDKLLSKLEKERLPDSNILIADSSFIHQTSESGDGDAHWKISLNQAAEDEAALRAAQNTEARTRQDVAKAGAEARTALGPRSGGYAEYFSELLDKYRRRGKR